MKKFVLFLICLSFLYAQDSEESSSGSGLGGFLGNISSWFGSGSSGETQNMGTEALNGSIQKFVQSTLSGAMSGSNGGASEGAAQAFSADITKYVQDVTQKSMKMASEMAEKQTQNTMKEINQMIQQNLKSALSSGSFLSGSQGAGFLNMDGFQKNLSDFINKAVQSGIQSGNFADQSKLLGDFFKSSGFQASVDNFEKMGGFDEKQFDSSMQKFESQLESNMQKMENDLKSSMENMQKQMEKQFGSGFMQDQD